MTHHRPAGFHTATPYLMVDDAARALRFYQEAFDATEIMRLTRDDGSIGHLEIKIGDSPIMIGQHANIQEATPREKLPRVSVYLYLENAEATASKALAAGAQELYPVTMQSYGVREGGMVDPFGIVWWLATAVERVAE